VANAKNNKVYVIGTAENNLFAANPNVEHVVMSDLESDEARDFAKHFVNYSTNHYQNELVCFLRIFYLKEFMQKYNYEKVFHLDSDCILFENTGNLFDASIEVAYSIQDLYQTTNPFHMVGSVHNSLLNRFFCEKFTELCFDIYKHKTKFHLIEPKIRWHKTNRKIGGICDMTLYYLLFSEKIVAPICNTNDILYVDGEPCIFDNQISDSYGFNGENTYVMLSGIKAIQYKNGKYYVLTRDNREIRALTLHFQGSQNKKLLGMTKV
jgi:hypothetical protein